MTFVPRAIGLLGALGQGVQHDARLAAGSGNAFAARTAPRRSLGLLALLRLALAPLDPRPFQACAGRGQFGGALRGHLRPAAAVAAQAAGLHFERCARHAPAMRGRG
jgi:hypothetical protein